MSDAVMASAPVVALEAVAQSYGQGAAAVEALRGVSLAVRPGELVALQGPSGSGKSTLLNLCGLLSEPTAGCIRLDGVDVGRWTAHQRTLARRERIGFVFQSFNLMPVLSVAENVEYPLLLLGVGASQRRERVARLLARLGLDALASRRPDELSGGQRQRVAIARAMVKRPRLVIADEPTANLDSVTAAQVVELMHEAVAHDGASFLTATHDPAVAARCTRVARIQDGCLLEAGAGARSAA